MINEELSRRSFLKMLGIAGVAATIPLAPLVVPEAEAEVARAAGATISGDIELDGRFIGRMRDLFMAHQEEIDVSIIGAAREFIPGLFDPRITVSFEPRMDGFSRVLAAHHGFRPAVVRVNIGGYFMELRAVITSVYARMETDPDDPLASPPFVADIDLTPIGEITHGRYV